MTDQEYQDMIFDAHSIPIIEVGQLVVTDFEYYCGKPTGKCCDHIDGKGNFSFKKEKNYAKCFTCQRPFTTINLVKAYKGYDFKNTIIFLYQNFPSYFRQEPFGSDYVFIKDDWDGLTNQEYMDLKILTRILVNGEKIQIKEFAKLYPLEHDILLITNIIKHKSTIEDIYYTFNNTCFSSINCDLEKIKQDRKDIYNKLLTLLKKGMRNKKLIKNCKTQINLENLLITLKNLQEKLLIVKN